MKRNLCKFIVALGLICMPSSAAFASATTINETEDNGTMAQAQLIQKNNATAASTVDGSYNGQCAIHGELSDSSDVDWYKVSLVANSDTILSINSKALSDIGIWEIYDENGNIIEKLTHKQNYNIMGATPRKVTISKTGTYYIKVYNDKNFGKGTYTFTIGNPNYNIDSYTYKASSPLQLTTSQTSDQATYDLSNIKELPKNAVVYDVTIDGSKINRATNEYRRIKLAGDSNWLSTSMYSYEAKIPVIMNKQLKDRWMVKLEGKVSKSSGSYKLTPAVKFSYVYPVLPE